jgi:IclR family mhp operon transcriptional activator
MSITNDLVAKGKEARRRQRRAIREVADDQRAGRPRACRTNSQRGSTDKATRSYPPVESIQRAFEILRSLNRLDIATVHDIYTATGYSKSTIVRVLETLISEGYVARDNLCGGYRVTFRTSELWAGSQRTSLIIEAARPHAIALTERTEWPAGIGVFDKDAISVQFSTAAICPNANTLALGWRLDLFYTGMGRCFLAFCPDSIREEVFKHRIDNGISDANEERQIRWLLPQIREEGFSIRGQNPSDRTSSVAAPLFNDGKLLAIMNLSYFRSAVSPYDIRTKLVAPLQKTTEKIEHAISEMRSAHAATA